MSNQNNPYPNISNQPLINDQHGYNAPNQPYNAPQNQGYIPPQNYAPNQYGTMHST